MLLFSLINLHVHRQEGRHEARDQGYRGLNVKQFHHWMPILRQADLDGHLYLTLAWQAPTRPELLEQIKDIVKAAVKAAVAPLDKSIRELTVKLASITTENAALATRLEKSEEALRNANIKIGAMEQYTRRSSVHLHNVAPESDQQKLEQLVDEITDVTKVDISSSNVVKCHWAGRPGMGGKRKVLVNFQNEKVRDKFLRSAKQLKGNPRIGHIVVHEDLTQTRYIILKRLLAMWKSKIIHFVCSYNGTMYYRIYENSERQFLTTTKEYKVLLSELDKVWLCNNCNKWSK